MSNKRTLIVGDVHGCFDELMELLEKVSYLPSEDRLIFLGDLINKGPRSLDVLSWVKKSGAEVLLGNHELGFLNYLKNPTPVFKGFGALAMQMKDDLDDWEKWISGLPLFIEEDDFIAVHGGIVPGFKVNEAPAHLLTRIRTWDGKGEDLNNEKNPPWYELYKEKKLVVFGHWAAKNIVIKDNVIGLDSGCCWGGALSLLHLETRKIYQVKAKEVYFSEP